MGSSKQRALIAVLVLVGILACALGFLMPWVASRQKMTLQDIEPKLPPLEKGRIHHPKGFSVIAPQGWFSKIETDAREGDNRIIITPSIDARWLPKFVVGLNDGVRVADINEYRPNKYLVYDAMIYENSKSDYYFWHAIFSFRDHQFNVLLMLPNSYDFIKYDKVPNQWLEFLNTFQIDQASFNE